MMLDGENSFIEICLVDTTHNTIQDALASFHFFPTMAMAKVANGCNALTVADAFVQYATIS